MARNPERTHAMKTLALSAAALLGLAGAAAACPDQSQWGNAVYNMTGSDLYARNYFDVTAGGSNSLSSCSYIVPRNASGEGWFTTAPDFSFDLTGMGAYQLEIRVTSECDAALLVNSARNRWVYDDDSNGNLDPAITLTSVADGIVDIWVGTYDGEYCPATLTLETFYR
jgi:hypothetical protein